MKCPSFSRQMICRFSLCLTSVTCVLLTNPLIANAQLKPWDHTNQVFVDLSVINDSSDLTKVNPFARFTPLYPRDNDRSRGKNLSNFEGQLLAPPKRRPVSSFLLKETPKVSRIDALRSNIKLISPKKFKRRSISSKKSKVITKQKLSDVRPKKIKKMAGGIITSQVSPKPKTREKSIAQTKSILPVKSENIRAGELPPAPKIAAAPPPEKNKTLESNKAKDLPENTAQKVSKPQVIQKAALPRTVSDTKSVNVIFPPGAADLNTRAKKALDKVAIKLKKDESIRMQLMAYAGEAKMSASKARRLSLSRALAIRSYLIEKGVRGTRIDVRALGNKTSSGLPNRVDLRVISQ